MTSPVCATVYARASTMPSTWNPDQYEPLPRRAAAAVPRSPRAGAAAPGAARRRPGLRHRGAHPPAARSPRARATRSASTARRRCSSKSAAFTRAGPALRARRHRRLPRRSGLRPRLLQRRAALDRRTTRRCSRASPPRSRRGGSSPCRCRSTSTIHRTSSRPRSPARSRFAPRSAATASRTAVLAPEAYAALLDRLGFAEQHVRLQVYGHMLPARDDVVEWVKGTLLTDYQRRMPAAAVRALPRPLSRTAAAAARGHAAVLLPVQAHPVWATR